MSEASWYRMLVISIIFHMVVIAVFSIPIKGTSRRIDLSSSYSVSLVGDIGGTGGKGDTGTSQGGKAPLSKAPSQEVGPSEKATKLTKAKPKLLKKESDALSLSKKNVQASKTPSQAEISRLEERLQELKQKTRYIDVTQGGGGSGTGIGAGATGLPLAGAGDAKPLDPVTQKYILEIWEKIRNAWGLPGIASFKKQLETIVTIKIRKDGRIVDIAIEKRSGNRIYDESVLRVLRAVDPLPPIPASLNTESIEIGFRFLPGEIS